MAVEGCAACGGSGLARVIGNERVPCAACELIAAGVLPRPGCAVCGRPMAECIDVQSCDEIGRWRAAGPAGRRRIVSQWHAAAVSQLNRPASDDRVYERVIAEYGVLHAVMWLAASA